MALCLKSLATVLFVHQFIQADNNWNITALHYWSLWGESTSDWWIPLTTGPVMRQLTPWHYHEFWCTHCFHHYLSGCSGPVFCLLLGVSSDYAQPITGQVTEVTCPVIGWAQPELTPSKRQKTGPGAVWHQPLNHYNISCDNTINSVALKLLNLYWQEGFKSSLMEVNINHNELILFFTCSSPQSQASHLP